MATLPIPPIPPDDPASVSMSPTTLVLNYIRSKGLQPTSANVMAALQANARDPTTIPGLRSDVPSTDSGPSVGRGGGTSVASKVESGGRGNPNTQRADMGPGTADFLHPPGSDAATTTSTGDTKTTSSQPTSAQPTSDSNLDLRGLGGAILAGGAGAAGLYGLQRALAGQPPTAEFMGNKPMDASGRVIDVPGSELPGGSNAAQLTEQRLLAGQAPPPPTDMEAAMQKAVAPAEPYFSDIYAGSPTDVIRDASKLPPGVTPTDAANVQLRTNPEAAVNPPYIGESPLPPRGPRVTVTQIPSVVRQGPATAARNMLFGIR